MTTKRKHDHPENKDDLPPRQIYNLRDYYQPTKTEPFHNDIYQENMPIAMDIGRSEFRIGMANSEIPNTRFPSVTSRYRDRKLNKSYVMVGNDVFIDSSIRSNLKTPFDGALITNWDAMERIFDYSFLHLGVNSNDRVNNPVVLNELLSTPLNQRSSMMELLFESYSVPKVCFGHDSLFSFYGNGGKSGLVIGTGHESTHIIPVIKGNPVINISKRIDIGGHQMTDFLKWFLGLKYPYFPTRITNWQIENMIHDHCYISKNFNKEIKTYLNLDNIEKNDIILEAPFTEVVKVEKTEEELKFEAQKRKENIKKLQDQAKTKRLEKLMIKEKDYQYYSDLKEKMKSMNKRQILEILREASFDDEEDLNKYLLSLERSLKRARQKDVGDIEEEETQQHDFSILDIPDSELDEDKIKEKRKLRLIKSNIDARIRARKEKEEAKKEADEAIRLDNEFREKSLIKWTKAKRQQLDVLVKRRRERLKLKEELTDRKSRAAQQRMKNIATLAADDTNAQGNSRNKKRQTNTTIDNDPNDTFGANDDDWAVYRDIASIDDEEIEEEEEDSIFNLEKELLEYDPTFTIEDTQERQFNWRNSTLHKFLRGPRDFDNEDQHQLHQIHLNIERIRIPEIMFQPSISGVDQAGIIEICDDTLTRRLPQELGFSGDYQEDINDVLKDIFITGGSGLFDNFEDRLRNEFKTFLPTHAKFNVRTASNPRLDAWKGMAKWSLSDEGKGSFISMEDYQELGVDYITENRMGCIKLI